MSVVPRSSLRSFLTTAKSTLSSAIVNKQRVTLVIGNESCDLDSITSSILYAYLRSFPATTPLTNASVNKHTPPAQYPPFYIPLLNIPRADIKIRPELLALLPHAGLDPDHLITLDDLIATPPAGLNPEGREELQPANARLVLTDHNKLAGPLAAKGFGEKVAGCIDHHVDEHAFSSVSSEPRIVRTAGSCTSLVLEYCKPVWDSISSSVTSASNAALGELDDDNKRQRLTWDAQLAKFAVASVLIDTWGLKDSNKTKDVDRDAVRYLQNKILGASEGSTWEKETFLEDINKAKGNLDGLSIADILKKDYKEWGSDVHGQLGVSSVVKQLAWMKEKAGSATQWRKEARAFAKSRKLSVLGVMTTSTGQSGDFQRELLVWAVDGKSDAIVEDFSAQFGDELGLQPWSEVEELSNTDKDEGLVKIWWQKEIKYSRKQVAPKLRKVME